MAEHEQPAPAAAAEKQEGSKKGRKGFGVNFKVSAKGAVSVYGLGRFPVTLYREQWLRLLERTDDLKRFLDEHAGELKSKGEGAADAATEPATEPTAGPIASPAIESVADLAGDAGTTSASAAATTVDDAAAGHTASDARASAEDDRSEDPDLPPDDYNGL